MFKSVISSLSIIDGASVSIVVVNSAFFNLNSDDLSYYDVENKNKRWGAAISLPSTIQSGNLNLSVPEYRTLDGQVINKDISSSLADGKQEVNYGIYYGKDKIGTMLLDYTSNELSLDPINGFKQKE